MVSGCRLCYWNVMRVLLLALVLSTLAMAEPPDISIIPTQRGIKYTLRPEGASGTELPAWVLLTCVQGDKVLGQTCFRFDTATEPDIWMFWKPILEKIAAKKDLVIEADGGMLTISAPIPAGPEGSWTTLMPAPSPVEGGITVIEKD